MIVFWGAAVFLALSTTIAVTSPLLFGTRQKAAGIILLLVIPAAAFSIYLIIGDSQQLPSFYQLQRQAQQARILRAQLGTAQQVIQALQQHLVENPTSAQGWYLLGRIYLSQNQLTPAVACFAKAYTLQPGNTQLMYDYAETLFLQNHNLQGTAEQLLQRILVKEPGNELAINLLAIASFQAKNYQQAVVYWESLLAQNTPDSADGRSLLKAIAIAQELAAKQQKVTQK